ncbi:MAG: polyprenyl synthetase family protein [Sulfolobales archaeon]
MSKRDLILESRAFEELLSYIESRREIIEKKIQEEIQGYEEEIAEIARYIVYGGKRLRGVLTLLISEALGGSVERALDASIAIEMVHSASLALDDIIDRDLFRRGRPASWIRFGLASTVLVSNFLIPKAQLMIRVYGFDALVNVIQAWFQATLGEILDVFGRLDVPASEYERIIDLKTGSVFKMAAYLGAKAASQSESIVKIAVEYGELLGRLYQIADDTTDLLSRDSSKIESKSIKLFLKWLECSEREIDLALERASEKIIHYINRASRKAVEFPENPHKKKLVIFPMVMIYALFRELGDAGVEFYYQKIFPRIESGLKNLLSE